MNTPNATKARCRARKTRSQVVGFRKTSVQFTTLTETYKRDAAEGVDSPNQLARKVGCDYLAIGRTQKSAEITLMPEQTLYRLALGDVVEGALVILKGPAGVANRMPV